MSKPSVSKQTAADTDIDYCCLCSSSTDEDILVAAERILRRRALRKGRICSVADCKQYFKLRLSTQEREVFGVLFLDNRHRVLSFEILFFGTIDGASVHPREVVKCALYSNAAAVVLVHNHPSGVAEPSLADRMLTDKLKDALAMIDVRVLDHFVIGLENVFSFAEHGLL